MAPPRARLENKKWMCVLVRTSTVRAGAEGRGDFRDGRLGRCSEEVEGEEGEEKAMDILRRGGNPDDCQMSQGSFVGAGSGVICG